MRTRPAKHLTAFSLIALLIPGIFVAALPGCGQGDAQPVTEQESASDASDTVRVAALLPFAADQLIEMGLIPVAVPLLRGELPPAWEGIPTIAIDHSAGPNLEQLMAVSPDVVVTTSVYAQFMPMIEQSTGAEIVVMDVDTMADVPKHINTLGEVTGMTESASELAESIENDTAESEPNEKDVRVLAVFGTPHAFYAFLPSSYLGDLVKNAGGTLITDDMETHGVFRGLAPLSMEVVIERDPDLLLVIFHGEEDSARAMLERDALWGQLSAVKAGRVTFLKDDLYAMRPGSEMPRAIEEIRSILEEARSELP